MSICEDCIDNLDRLKKVEQENERLKKTIIKVITNLQDKHLGNIANDEIELLKKARDK